MLLQPHQHTDDEAEGENPNPQGLAGYGGNSIQRRSRRFFSKFSVRRTASTGQMAHDPGAPRLKRNGSSLQDTFLFWRRGSAPLPSIEESESSTVELTKHGGEVDSSVRGPGANANGGENKEASSPPPVMVQIDTPVTSPKAAPATAPPADGLPLPAPVRLAPCGGTPRAGASPASARARHRLGPGGTPLAGGRGASPPSRPVSLQRTTSNVSRQSRRAERVEELANDLDQPLRRGELMAKMAKLERYIRKNELELSFKDALSRFESCDEGNETEAKRVAYYLVGVLHSHRSSTGDERACKSQTVASPVLWYLIPCYFEGYIMFDIFLPTTLHLRSSGTLKATSRRRSSRHRTWSPSSLRRTLAPPLRCWTSMETAAPPSTTASQRWRRSTRSGATCPRPCGTLDPFPMCWRR